ncbi:MAG: AsmA-like C-terminal domain-containing protein [Kiloniellaceae bacterium]
MIRRTARIALELVTGVLAVLVLLIGMALWRLSTGPVQLDFLTPEIEAALAGPDGGLTVKIGATVLTWEDWRRTIDLHARDIKIRDRDGFTVASLPDVLIGLSLRALVQGTVAPTVVEVVGARLTLVRDADGQFTFAGWNGDRTAPSKADLSGMMPTVLRQLMSEPAAEEPLSFLRVVRIVGGRVFVIDRKLSRIWEAPVANIELRRDAVGLAGELDLDADLGETRANFDAGFLYDKASGVLDLTAGFTELYPEALASVAPRLAALAGLTMPLNGSVSASLTVNGALDRLRFDVNGGAGELAVPEFLPEVLPVRALTLQGRLSGPERRVDLETASLSLGTPDAPGPEISAVGSLTSAAAGFTGDMVVEAELEARNVPLRDLGRYWPLGVSGYSRQWVRRNIARGVVDRAVLWAALHVPDGDFAASEVRRLDGTLEYRDLEVHFLRPLPPVTGIRGTGTFDRGGLVFLPEDGRLGELRVRPSRVEISGLETSEDSMAIDLAVVGPLRASLELLDHERLGLVRRLGIDPAKTDGQMAARVEFRFSILSADLTFDDIEVAAKANMAQAAVQDFLLGRDAANGTLALALDKKGMHVTGPLELGHVPIEMDWHEAFSNEAPYRTRLKARVDRIDDAGRRHLGLDLAPYLEGPVSASVVFTAQPGGRGTVKAAVNLQEAALAIAPLSWAKRPGIEGEAHLALEIRDQRPVELSQIDITADTLSARGKGRFDDTGRNIASLMFDELAFDGTSLTGVAVGLRDEGLDVRIGGGVLDAAPFLNGDATKGEAESETADGSAGKAAGDSAADGDVAAGAEDDTVMPFNLSARRLEAVYFGPGRFLADVDLELTRGSRGWRRIGLEGRVPRDLWTARGAAAATQRDGVADKILRIDFGPAKDGGQDLRVTADDMGAVLRALDILDTIDGGRLEITGASDGPMPDRPIKGRIEARDYVLIEAPTLAKLLTVASFTGIVNRLKGQGIEFKRLVGEFTLRDGVLRTDLMRAYGPALGLTGKGELNFRESSAELRGTVVPAYTVNRILGDIPVLGFLLTGGKGQGLVAVTYRMTGDLDDPEVSVNPLSALAPGFLRGLFGVFDAGSAEHRPRALPEREDR